MVSNAGLKAIAMLNLVTFKKDGSRKDIPLEAGEYTVGRKADADLRIPLNQISRAHCELTINGSKVTIRDLGSSNGTFVNRQRITEATLSAGDQITVGPVTFIVQIDGQPSEVHPPTASAPDDSAAPLAAAEAPTQASAEDVEFDIDDLSDLDIDNLSDIDLDGIGEGDMDDAAVEFLKDDDSGAKP